MAGPGSQSSTQLVEERLRREDTYIYEVTNLFCSSQPDICAPLIPFPSPRSETAPNFLERHEKLTNTSGTPKKIPEKVLINLANSLQNNTTPEFKLKQGLQPGSIATIEVSNPEIEKLKNVVQNKSYTPPPPPPHPTTTTIPKKRKLVTTEINESCRKKQKKEPQKPEVDMAEETDTDSIMSEGDSEIIMVKKKIPTRSSTKRSREEEENIPEEPKKKKMKKPEKKPKKKPKKKKKTVPDAAKIQGEITSGLFKRFEQFLDDFVSDYDGEDLENIPLGRSISGKIAHIFGKNKKLNLDWRSLSGQIIALSKRKLLSQVNVDDLYRLQILSQKQMEAGRKLNIFTPYNVPEEEIFECMNKSIESALICLHIMTEPNISRRLIREGSLRTLLKLLKHYVSTALIPWKDPLYWTPSEKIKKTKGKKKKPKLEENKREFFADIQREFGALHQNCCHLLDNLQKLIRMEPSLEEQLMPVLEMCFSVFKAEDTAVIELACVGVVNAIFVHNSNLRLDIIKRIIDVIFRAPKSRKRNMSIDAGAKKKGINIMHGLLLLCFQCLPTNSVEPKNVERLKVLHEEIRNETHTALFEEIVKASSEETETLIQKFAQIFVVRFAHSKVNDKNLVTELVKDLLAIWFLPEWPAAENLLYSIGHVFFQIMAIDNKKKVKQRQNARLLAVNVIGDICRESLIHLKIIRETPVLEIGARKRVRASNEIEDVDESAFLMENARCVCGTGYDDQTMLDCDDCHNWFHTKCVNLDDDNLPDEWVCHSCQIRNAVQAQFTESDTDFSFDDDDSADIVRLQLLINYLASQSFHDQSLNCYLLSRQYHLMQFLTNYSKIDEVESKAIDEEEEEDSEEDEEEEDTEEKEKKKEDKKAKLKRLDDHSLFIFRNQWLLPEQQYQELPTFTREGVISINRQLAAKRLLLKTSKIHLNFICKSLHDQAPSFRTKAMKALGQIIEGDPLVLKEQRVLDAVKQRFRDKSASVREAAIDVIGKYALSNPELVLSYYNLFRDRINDAGLSVRKRVIKIFREICLRNPKHPKYIDMCVQLLRHVNETNKTIRDLVTQTFETIWFSDGPVLKNRTKRSLLEDGKKFTSEFDSLVQQIVDVIGELMKANADHAIVAVVDLVTQMLDSESGSRKNAKKDSNKKTKLFNVCQDICSCIVEKIMDYDQEEINTLLPIIKTLHIFCTVRPVFVVAHHGTLQPYLKPPSDIKSLSKLSKEDVSNIHVFLQTLAEIMHMILPLVEGSSPNFRKHLTRDLCSLVLNYPNFSVMRQCIPCLCVLCQKVSRDTTSLKKFLDIFLGILISTQKGNPQDDRWIRRALFCVGLFCKYFDFDKHFPTSTHQTKNGATNLTGVAYEMFIYFSHSKETMHRISAIQGLSFLFNRRPRLLLEQNSRIVLKQALAEDSENKLKYHTLVAMKEFLDSERKRIQFLQKQNKKKEKENGDEKEKTGHHSDVSAIRSEDQSDPGIVAGVMQELIPPILGLCKNNSQIIREHSIRLLREILNQGMINPVDVMPTLISLTTDSNQITREQAMQELKIIGSKYPLFFKSRLLPGIIDTFRFHKKINAETFSGFNANGNGEIIEQFRALYRTLREVKNFKSVRFDFIKAMLNMAIFEKAKQDIEVEYFAEFVCFTMSILSVLPFNLDEPIFVVKWIDSLLSGEALEVDTHLNELKDKMIRDPETQAEISNFTPELIKQYAHHCKRAVAFTAVIKLREHLKYMYNLTYNTINKFEESTSCKIQCNRRFGQQVDYSLEGLPCQEEEMKFDEEFTEIPEILENQHSVLSETLSQAVTDVDHTTNYDELEMMKFDSDEEKKPQKSKPKAIVAKPTPIRPKKSNKGKGKAASKKKKILARNLRARPPPRKSAQIAKSKITKNSSSKKGPTTKNKKGKSGRRTKNGEVLEIDDSDSEEGSSNIQYAETSDEESSEKEEEESSGEEAASGEEESSSS